MKKNVFLIPEIISLITLVVFAVGWIMQAQKANIETIRTEHFAFVMSVYKIGNVLITIAICLTVAAIVGWIIAALIKLRK